LIFSLEVRIDAVPSQKPTPCLLRSQFGKNIVHLRTAKGLTQESLAETVGISARYTQSIEAGEYFPALPTLAKLKKALGASWNEMFRGCGE
jgi:transcriptional regulator with XRE-family HTH domain